MNKQIKRFCVTVIMLLAIYCLCSPFSYAYVWQNWRECANYPCSSTVQATSSLLKTYLVESAGYFLTSHSDYHAFLNRVELTDANGINCNELMETICKSIENMEKAKAAYTNLKITSEKTPYNQEFIDQLMKFEYDSFRIQNGLIEPIFAKVKNLLSKGDISGIDMTVLANLNTILIKLYEVKVVVDKGQVPEISLLWRINQMYAEAHLFGQYVSEVFKDILF